MKANLPDEALGGFCVAQPRLYALFHEAVAQPKVREWLDFSDEDYTAHNDSARRALNELLSPRSIDEEARPPKLQTARDIRSLKDIVDSPAALRILVDPKRPLQDAVLAAENDSLDEEPGKLEASLAQALHALRQPPIDQ